MYIDKNVITMYHKVFWADNPRDLQMLRHDKTLHTVKVKQHMKNVPDYLGSVYIFFFCKTFSILV